MPPFDRVTSLYTFYPTQSSKNVTGFPNSDWRGSSTGFKECFAVLCPLGLPRWESKTKDLGLCLSNYWIVGIVPGL